MVRLPRDWLGPREELVPFGPSAASDRATEPPPSAEDFWGERSAAIHDALQAPPDPVVASAGARARRRIRTRPLAAAVGGLAVAVLLIIAVVSTFSGAGRASHPATGSKVGVAAVFGGGVSRLLQLGLAKLEVKVPQAKVRHAGQSRTTSAKARRAPHRAPASRPHRRTHPQLSSTPAVSIDTAHATTTTARTYAARSHVDTTPATSHFDTTPTYRSAPPSPPSRPAASQATVSSTGESGALGPIQSPNG